MSFMNWIVSLLAEISDLFASIYREVFYWWPPFNEAAPFFFTLYWAFYDLTYDFAAFRDWVYYTNALVQELGIWGAIKELIRGWLPGLENALAWLGDWVYWVYQTIGDWWLATQDTVKGWILAATEGFSDLVAAWDEFWTIIWPAWAAKLDLLKDEWDDFWVLTFPTLVSFSWLTTWWIERVEDVERLIKDAFTFREDLVYLQLQDLIGLLSLL